MCTIINVDQLNNDLKEGLLLLKDEIGFSIGEEGLKINAYIGQPGYEKGDNFVNVYYDQKTAFFRELALALNSLGTSKREEKRVFETLSLMVDNSRTAVMNVEGVKSLLRELAVLGYNELQLYTEDTYEVEDEPYFGYLRGRYSKEEIKEIDAYAIKLGIELVPCIQTLAHLRSIYRWSTYYSGAFDCFDVLLINSPRTKILIENMFKSIAQMFTSRRINVGMDEAHMLGRGKYMDKNGFKERDELYQEHLAFVRSLALKYGFKMQFWGDMIASRYHKEKAEGKEPTKVFDDVTIIQWGYGNPYGEYEPQLKDRYLYNELTAFKEVAKSVRYCGAVHKYYGFTPCNKFSLPINEHYLNQAEEVGIKEVMISAWGDCGNETPIFATLPNLAYYASRAYGNKDMQTFEKDFTALYGDFEAFMKIDIAANLKVEHDYGFINSSPKYLLYNDTFLGCMDMSITPEIADAHKAHLTQLREAKGKTGKYEYLFDTQIALLEALQVKYDLGVKTRKAYKLKNNAELEKLAKEVYPLAQQKIRAFYEVFKKQWMKINKPHGIDVTDIRIGALLFRLENNAKRILDYLDGKLEKIDELEETILDEFGQGNRIIMQNWGETVTPNTLVEYLPYV